MTAIETAPQRTSANRIHELAKTLCRPAPHSSEPILITGAGVNFERFRSAGVPDAVTHDDLALFVRSVLNGSEAKHLQHLISDKEILDHANLLTSGHAQEKVFKVSKWEEGLYIFQSASIDYHVHIHDLVLLVTRIEELLELASKASSN